MQQVTLNLYSITEINGKAKETALEEYRYINVEHNWWGTVYDDFAEICKTIGITVDTESIYFRGFYSQGDGSAFDAIVNIPACIEAISNEAWKQYAPNEKLNLTTVEVNKRVLRLFTEQLIDAPKIVGNTRAYYVTAEQPYDFENYKKTDFSNIENHLENMLSWVKSVGKELNRFLYKSLQREYEGLITDEAVEDAIEANEYVFTSDGKKANKLLRLADLQTK